MLASRKGENEMESKGKNRLIRGIICIAAAVIIWNIPMPEGVRPEAWHLFAIFAGTILSFILQPMSLGASAIFACTASAMLGVMKPGEALSGFSNGTVWLIVSAFMFAIGFIKTGLGQRIAYIMLSKFGSSSLRVAYIMSIADFIIAPFTPSNTARGGGIIYPIISSICSTLKIDPSNEKYRRTGQFLIYSSYVAVITSACIFLTGASNNALAASLASELFGVTLGWTDWFIACIVPGLILEIISPIILYKIINPELKKTPETMKHAKNELSHMGAMTIKEKVIGVIFICCLLLWATGSITHFDNTFIALSGLVAMIITGCIKWDDVLEEKGAWDVLVWMGVLVNMAAYLSKFGLMSWFAGTMSDMLAGMSWVVMMIVAAAVYVYIHYFFASNSAHVAALFAAFGTVLIAAGAPALGVLIMLGTLANACSFLTHYGCGVTPIFFGAGFMEQGQWWKIGFLLSTLHIIVWLGIGMPWMYVCGFFG